jgi:hypothetical protein
MGTLLSVQGGAAVEKSAFILFGNKQRTLRDMGFGRLPL